MTDYADFLSRKTALPPSFGREPGPISTTHFHAFQRDVIAWAVRRGRAAVFAGTGLGKTRIQVECARQLRGDYGRVLFVAPLSVAEQTIAEAAALGINVVKVARPSEDAFQITNYEKLSHFIESAGQYEVIVLDESSILKSLDGKTRTLLIESFTGIPKRLCFTATPAPNDVAELANHAEFLGVMSRVEMLANFFVHDSDRAGEAGWRLKGHARQSFWKWCAQWAAFIRKPSDLGYEDGGWDLPALSIDNVSVEASRAPGAPRSSGLLFGEENLGGIVERRAARKQSIAVRVEATAELIRSSLGQWLVWCGLNDEGDALEKALGDGCVQISGRDNDEAKIAKESLWRSGGVRVLITKPKIFGWGLNWQHCNQMAFLGLGDSYEEYFQAIRRCWRFGQKRDVRVVIVTSEKEKSVIDNVRRKELEAETLMAGVAEHSREEMTAAIRGKDSAASDYRTDDKSGDGWQLMLGDCVERIRDVPDSSVGLSVFSPPFASLYTYSASDRDMGNNPSHEAFFEHFLFLIRELKRVTKPGRLCAVHCQQLTTTLTTHGVVGMVDFRAQIVRAFQSEGWVYHGEVVIDKCPQAQAIRTKSQALMFVQLRRDSSKSRPAMADYICLFRHPDDIQETIDPELTNDEWIKWARPIWYDIKETNTLNAKIARSDKDERHICPLQLETIERCLRLWSNRGDTVLSPFAGIGSEGYVSLRHGRKFIGIELKPEYFAQAVKNVSTANRQTSLFDVGDVE